MRRIAIAAAKGGTGKTTTAVSLAHALALAGRNVLLVDCDPRRHAALHFGVPRSAGLAAWLAGARSQAWLVRPGLRVLDSGGTSLRRPSIEDQDGDRLRRCLDSLRGMDYVLLDCAPDSGPAERQALCAADEVLVPVACDFLGLVGAEALRDEIATTRPSTAPPRRFLGVLPTFYEPDSGAASRFESSLAQRFPEQVLQARVRICDALRFAAEASGSVFDTEPMSQGALDYAHLAAALEVAA